MMQETTAVAEKRELLEAGVHFGHPTRRWDPKMKPYIFAKRNGIYIIDLEKTLHALEDAYFFVRDLVKDGGVILFLGTKKQAQQAIEDEARRCGMPYINQHWIGGLLTNWKTIKKRIDRLHYLDSFLSDPVHQATLPKKEFKILEKERDKLFKVLAGIKDMPGVPDALFVVDILHEAIAVAEGNKSGLPVVAVLDTNCNPDLVDYGIPGNDDAIRSIKLFTEKIANGVLEGKRMREGIITPPPAPESAPAGEVVQA